MKFQDVIHVKHVIWITRKSPVKLNYDYFLLENWIRLCIIVLPGPLLLDSYHQTFSFKMFSIFFLSAFRYRKLAIQYLDSNLWRSSLVFSLHTKHLLYVRALHFFLQLKGMANTTWNLGAWLSVWMAVHHHSLLTSDDDWLSSHLHPSYGESGRLWRGAFYLAVTQCWLVLNNS